jgi:hypothetical protein
MFGRLASLLLSFPILIALANSGEWWEEKPFSQWSSDQIYEFLDNSPWVRRSNGYFQQPPWASRNKGDSGQPPLAMIHYQARILTAKPVREAFLQLYVLNAKIVSAKEINAATAAEESQKRLRELLESYPNDWLIKGDEKHLIIAISQKIHTLNIYGIKSSQEVFRNDELSDVDQSKLFANTSLSTNTGKRIELENYTPPGTNGAGAMYYFPRNLPDGTPLVAGADKELLFETVINKRPVKIKFDLRKLKYKGKLEI